MISINCHICDRQLIRRDKYRNNLNLNVMKKMEKINLLKKADVLTEKDMKILIGGENDACGGGGYQLFSCAWDAKGYPLTHAWVCATNVTDAWEKLSQTIYNQLQIHIQGVCSTYK